MGESELDEILDNYAKAYYEAKYESELNTCEWAMDKAKQALLNWHNKQTLELLDRLAAQRGILSDPVHGEKSIPLSAIEAERNKLKESK